MKGFDRKLLKILNLLLMIMTRRHGRSFKVSSRSKNFAAGLAAEKKDRTRIDAPEAREMFQVPVAVD